MKCSGCGAEGNGNFCEYCGTALEQKSEIKINNEEKLSGSSTL